MGEQSIDMLQTEYGALGLQVEQYWRKLWNKSLTNLDGTGQLGGLTIVVQKYLWIDTWVKILKHIEVAQMVI